MKIRLALGIVLIPLTGCFATYQPMRIDEKTNMYSTAVQVDPAAITIFDTSIDPKKFQYVLIKTESDLRPSVFVFMLRQALSHAGITRVYTTSEFAALANDLDLNTKSAESITDVARSVAKNGRRVLIIDYSHNHGGSPGHFSTLTVVDAGSGDPLLHLYHRRTVWSNVDSESFYPVLNQLRKWINESSREKV